MEPVATQPTTDALRFVLDGEHRVIRDRVRAILSEPRFGETVEDLPAAEYRELVMRWARDLARGGQAGLGFPEQYGGMGEVGGSVAAFEMLALGDLSLLVKVFDLHVIALLERERAWFQEHGRISSTRAKALIRLVNSLCAELRPQARMLVDGFNIPDRILRAPIALET